MSPRVFRCDNCSAVYLNALAHPGLGAVCPVCVRPVSSRPSTGRSLGSKLRARIAERDGWTCHLCGKPIDPDVTGSHAATVDHLVPRSRGGSNDIENLRLAHQCCNWRRGDKPLTGASA